jgi:hypothetical protein
MSARSGSRAQGSASGVLEALHPKPEFYHHRDRRAVKSQSVADGDFIVVSRSHPYQTTVMMGNVTRSLTILFDDL